MTYAFTYSNEGYTFKYNGSLTVNVYMDGENIDCFTLGQSEDNNIPSITRLMDNWIDMYG